MFGTPLTLEFYWRAATDPSSMAVLVFRILNERRCLPKNLNRYHEHTQRYDMGWHSMPGK